MANPQTVHTRPKWLNANTLVHGCWDLRPPDFGFPAGPGVAGYEDFRVMQDQSGATMNVDVGKTGVGLMKAWVQGTTRTGQGLYECDNIDWTQPTSSAYVPQLEVTVSANASGNPRLDMVVLEVLDQQHTGASSLLQLRVVAGTATAAASLDNRNGAATLPASCIHLADILVPNGAGSIVTADIRDRRAFPLWGTVPPLLTDVDVVSMVPVSTAGPVGYNSIDHNGTDTFQSAAATFLPRRIPGATRIRWAYTQGATAMTGSYVLAIFDASGRRIVDTGSVAYTGTANTRQTRSETITATTFEAGVYYTFFGHDSATVGATFSYLGVYSLTPATANAFVSVTTGGVTVPTTLLSMTDIGTQSSTSFRPAVPVVGLSVG